MNETDETDEIDQTDEIDAMTQRPNRRNDSTDEIDVFQGSLEFFPKLEFQKKLTTGQFYISLFKKILLTAF